MLCLLLDEHIFPRLVRQFLAKCSADKIVSILEWEDGQLTGTPNDVLLTHAHAHGLMLVTYDQSTITPLLMSWGEQGIPHGGVTLIDERTISQDDFGGILKALIQLWEKEKNADWASRVIYLTRASGK